MKFKILKFDYLKKEKNYWSIFKNVVSSFKVLFFGLTKQQKYIKNSLYLQKILAHLN